MIKDRILTHWEEAVEKILEEAELKVKEAMILEMKKENISDELIAKIANLPLETINQL